MSYLALTPFAAIYLAEPLWRSEVVTLLGLSISIRLRNGLSLILAALGSVLALWILQPIIIGFIFWFTGWAVNRFLSSVIDAFALEVIIFLAAVYIAVVFFGFYAVIRKNTYRRLIRWIDRAEA